MVGQLVMFPFKLTFGILKITLNPKNWKWVIPLILLLVLAWNLIVVEKQLVDHGFTKHGMDSIAATSCLNKQGPDLVYRKGIDNNRAVSLCLIPDPQDPKKIKNLGVVVKEFLSGKWQPITSYTIDDINTIDGAINYAEGDMGQWGYIDYLKAIWRGKFNIPLGPPPVQ